MTVRELFFWLGKKQAELSLIELDSAGSKNQVLNVLCFGKETEVTWTYGKKAAEIAIKGTEAVEDFFGSLTESMPFEKLKKASTQLCFSIIRFVEDFYTNF